MRSPTGWHACNRGTVIDLPYVQDASDDGVHDKQCSAHFLLEMKRKLRDIHPSLLLFLNRLRSIEVIDVLATTRRTLSMEASGDFTLLQVVEEKLQPVDEIGFVNEHGINTTAICQGSVSFSTREKWFVVAQVYNLEVYQESKCTKLAVAFPIQSSWNIVQRQVFAYLPVRSYGFRFLLQGECQSHLHVALRCKRMKYNQKRVKGRVK